jgi:glycosyltransferase involved in cell wall biosynthesis
VDAADPVGFDPDTLDVVIAHDWITVPGGAEKVVQALCEMFPRARIVAAVVDPAVAQRLFPGHRVESLGVGRLPGARTHWPYYGPAMLAEWAVRRVGPADVLISSTHFGALGAGRRFAGPHLAYVHTPLRMAWRPDLEVMRLPPALAPVGRVLAPALRRVDRRASRHVDSFVANSHEVQRRILDAYGRASDVVFPPVDVEVFRAVPHRPSDYLVAFGRLVAYKRVDLAVEACTRLGVRLVVAGDGPDRSRLEAMAGPTVEFVGRVSDPEYHELLSGARALLFPGEDDFGIVPVEAQAAGCPVIAFGRGGALDTVDPRLGNRLVNTADAGAFAGAIRSVLDQPDDHEAARRQAADRFGIPAFRAGITRAVGQLLRQHSAGARHP